MRARERVVEAHRADRSQAVRSRASSRESAARTAASSGPRSAPVSARRRDAQVAADGLELAHDRARLVRREPFGCRLAQLAEALERGLRVVPELGRLGRERRAARTRAPRRATALPGAPGRPRAARPPPRELRVGHRGDRIHREPPQAGEVELHVVLGQPELLEVRAHGRRREALLAELARRRSGRGASRASSRPDRARARGGSPPAARRRERARCAAAPGDSAGDPSRGSRA